MNYSGQDLMLFRYYLTCFSTVWPHDLTLLTVDWSKSYTCATGFNHRLCSHSHSQVEIGIELKNCDPEGRYNSPIITRNQIKVTNGEQTDSGLFWQCAV